MAAIFKIAFLVLGFVALINAQSSSNQASQSNLQSITQGIQGVPNFPGSSGGTPGFPGMGSGVASVPGGMSGFPGLGSFSSSPQVTQDMFELMTDPCTYKTLQGLAKLSSDMRAAREKEGKKIE